MLKTEKPAVSGVLLPVKVSTPTVLATERSKTSKATEKEPAAYVEVDFAGGQRLCIRGTIDRQLLKDLISVLISR